MQTAESEDALLVKAKAEEKAYNWVEAAKLYEQVAESFLGKNSTDKAAETYRMLGYAYSRAARTVYPRTARTRRDNTHRLWKKESKQFRERHEHAIIAYRKAMDLFKRVKNKPEELECEGLVFYVTSISLTSLTEAKDAISKSLELFIQSSKFYTENNDEESIARTLSQAAITSFVLLNLCSEQEELLEVSQKGIEISTKTRKFSKKIRNFQYYTEALSTEVELVSQTVLKTNLEHGRRLFLKYEKYLKIVEDLSEYKDLTNLYFAVGLCYGELGVMFSENENDQSECYDKAISCLEKSEEFARKTKDTFLLVRAVYYLNWTIVMSGRWDLYTKRDEWQEFHMFTKLSKIFANSVNHWNMITNLYLTVACTVHASEGNLPLYTRKHYAEMGIQYALKTLGMTSFSSTCGYLYLKLNECYSLLAYFASMKKERDEHAKKMFQFVKEAEQVGKNYTDGYPVRYFPPQVSYNYALMNYLRFQADMTENKDNKIKYFNEIVTIIEKVIISLKSSSNFFPIHLMESNFHLGYNYYNISILTNDSSFLKKAKEKFLEVIKETFKTGNIVKRSDSYEWIALIEDRNGNYMVSAEYYEKVQISLIKWFEETSQTHKEIIKSYDAKISIEQAKAYHKVEDHLKAKECYIKASKITEELSSYIENPYWAPHWKAWALLEEAEFLSKQESLEEAIKVYESAKSNFQNAIDTVKQTPKQINLPLGFIDFLEKLAQSRVDYCSARIALENARILGKKGKHIKAAEIFASTASQFMELCEVYKLENEHRELESIYHLCRAWEQMELAEEFIESDRFKKAADQFTKASNFSNESKYKLLASGNSAYCLALEHGCEFDKSYDTDTKAQLYPKIKSILRNAASLYEKGGFKGAANWALATSTYFDAAWHLVKADELLEIKEKKKILGIASRYLKSALELFSKSGYRDKEKEILEWLERVKREEEIHISALNSIEKPAESISTAGIGAPACPLETSKQPRVEELLKLIQDRDISEEIVKISEKRKFPLKLIITEVVLSIAVLLLIITQHFLYALEPGEKVCFPLETTCFPIRNLVDPFLWTAIAAQIVVIILIIFVSFKQQIHEILTSLKHHLSRNEENQNKD